jgi:phage terminase small subunit
MTQKRENFCRAYVECGVASEAYRRAFDAGRMKPETIHKRASELLADGEVAGRVAELQAEAARRHGLTIDGLIAELEADRMIARIEGQGGAMVSATMGKAKLAGLDRGGPINFPLPPVTDTASALKARSLILEGLTRGRLLPDEADRLRNQVDGYERGYEKSELETLLRQIEDDAERTR